MAVWYFAGGTTVCGLAAAFIVCKICLVTFRLGLGLWGALVWQVVVAEQGMGTLPCRLRCQVWTQCCGELSTALIFFPLQLSLQSLAQLVFLRAVRM